MPQDIDKAELVKLCQKFVIDNKIRCAESISQMDHVIANAYDFLEAICEVIGYYDDDTDALKSPTAPTTGAQEKGWEGVVDLISRPPAHELSAAQSIQTPSVQMSTPTPTADPVKPALRAFRDKFIGKDLGHPDHPMTGNGPTWAHFYWLLDHLEANRHE